MSEEYTTSMEAHERDEFLGPGGIAVLALAAGPEPPHAIPVSYGYDVTTATFYFRLASGASSEKGELDGRAATVVVSDSKEDGWRSVVARGKLEDVEREGIETETLAGLDRVDIPLVDIFNDPIRDVQFEFLRLVPEKVTGRVERSGG